MLAAFLSDWPMWASLGVVCAAICFYMIDRWSMELVSVCVIAALLVLFTLPGAHGEDGTPISAQDLLSGFGNPALITIMALLVIGQGLFQTGALEGPTKALLSGYDRRPRITLLLAFLAVFAISAFVNNTPIVIMFLPVMSAIAHRMKSSASKLMMPLSFISIFAGMTTLIGTSTNLLAAEAFDRLEGRQLGFFEQSPMGLLLAGAGMIYLLVFSRFLLPVREGLTEDIAPTSSKQFLTQIEVTHGHFLEGKKPIAGMFTDLPDMTVRMIQRGERAFLPPYEDIKLRPGDLVIVAATRAALQNVLARQPDFLQQVWQSAGGDLDDSGKPRRLSLTEAVIAPGSRMVGRTVEMLGFRRLTRAVTLGIQRRSRMIRTKLGEIRLESGDTLLLCGPPDAFLEMRQSRDLILLEWSQTEIPLTTKALAARIISLVMVGAAASGVLSILHASVLAAVAMLVTGCLNYRQASRSLDLRIFLVIGAALAMGMALEKTGAASAIAHTVVNVASPYGTLAVLSALFLAVAILTNLLSNAATAILFSPIALSAAHEMNLSDPLPFLLAVIYGSNCSFATPIAYQTNMLVMGPGHYRFGDFVRFGGPLVFVLWCVFTVFASWRFDL
ncbi:MULTISPECIES: SLC13 family permease [Hyphomonas]|nr:MULTISPECIES: SLC13 family permease [Hyphomonas]MBB39166.1 SLC13 family permease [Hyphomonas sp.]HAE25838.1 SLC13 family permease [Hyphomonas adhaerens]